MTKPKSYNMRFIDVIEGDKFRVRIGSKDSHYMINKSFNPRKCGGILKAKKKPKYFVTSMKKYTTKQLLENC